MMEVENIAFNTNRLYFLLTDKKELTTIVMDGQLTIPVFINSSECEKYIKNEKENLMCMGLENNRAISFIDKFCSKFKYIPNILFKFNDKNFILNSKELLNKYTGNKNIKKDELLQMIKNDVAAKEIIEEYLFNLPIYVLVKKSNDTLNNNIIFNVDENRFKYPQLKEANILNIFQENNKIYIFVNEDHAEDFKTKNSNYQYLETEKFMFMEDFINYISENNNIKEIVFCAEKQKYTFDLKEFIHNYTLYYNC